ncbi:MAG: metallophosphoesterase [Oscillospiraceae bacterium]|nr:metallophosphoesterase [Oscillospiraceae bacterium]MBR7009935.1 metallophosphoesterase [Oscillospiraceae bacterium]
MRKRFHIGLGILAAVILICGIAVGISILVCNSGLAVHAYDIQIKGIGQPFTAVVLTDLHGKEFGEGNEELLEKIRGQKPDVIFSVGDMIDGDADQAQVRRFLELLAELRKIAPVYVSYGNHEKAYMSSGGTDLAPGIEAAGAVLLDESCVTAELGGNKVCLGGTVGHLYPFGRTPEDYHASPEYRLMKQMEASGLPTIVLAHLPDTIIFVEAYKNWDIDLFLSGHTHGGVIRIPFFGGLYAPMQGWFPDEDMGHFDYGRVQLLISSGLAGHGKVPRVFNMPEVCVVHIS